MKQIGLKGEKICSGQEISDGRMDKRMDGRTDRLITIGHTQSGALIIATSRGTTTMPITSKKVLEWWAQQHIHPGCHTIRTTLSDHLTTVEMDSTKRVSKERTNLKTSVETVTSKISSICKLNRRNICCTLWVCIPVCLCPVGKQCYCIPKFKCKKKCIKGEGFDEQLKKKWQ